jgi:hypothetical protein
LPHKATATPTDGAQPTRPVLKSRHDFDSLDALLASAQYLEVEYFEVKRFEVAGQTPAAARREN